MASLLAAEGLKSSRHAGNWQDPWSGRTKGTLVYLRAHEPVNEARGNKNAPTVGDRRGVSFAQALLRECYIFAF